jgi:hypothetical protein
MVSLMKNFILIIISFAVLVGCTQNTDTSQKEDNWEVSPFFHVGIYKMIGLEGKLGFIYVPFKANKGQKYMWHFWGEEKELKGNFEVVATNKETEENITVFQRDSLAGAHNSANAHTPSMIMLPTAGLWRLDAYIGGTLFGTIIVEVQE